MKNYLELKKIGNMYLAVLENEELDEQTIKDTQESIIALLENQTSDISIVIKEKIAKIEMLKKIGDEYKEKAKKEQMRIDKLKEIIKDVMKGMDLKKIETETGTFTIRKNVPSLIVENQDLIPRKFIEIIQSENVKKNEIKEALKNNEVVEGVRLQNSESLLIK